MIILKKTILELLKNKWTIGFIIEEMDSILDPKRDLKVHWLKSSYNKGWFADPFILDIDDKFIFVLVEEYYYPIKRGRISLLTVNKNSYELVNVQPILQLDTHLSFPAIFRDGQDIYIYPENCKKGQLVLYKLDLKEKKCIKEDTLCNLPLTDAILTEVIGGKTIFSTQLPNPNGNILNLYSKKNGSFVYDSSCQFETNVARNAGDWFVFNNEIYRPAQDCNQTYGGAVIIQKVYVDSYGRLSFTEVKRIESNLKGYTIGCHTFNYFKGVGVIDAKGYRYPLFSKAFLFVRSLWD